MLRIWSEQANGATRDLRIRVEGQVRGPWVAELERVVEDGLGRGLTLTLDLSGVSFVDAQGVRLLRSLPPRQVDLANCSPFTAEQLRS